MSDKIKYVKHPVSAEEKEKLVKQGFKIIDAKFEPKKAENKPEPKKAEK